MAVRSQRRKGHNQNQMLGNIRNIPAMGQSLSVWSLKRIMPPSLGFCLTCAGMVSTLSIFILAAALATFPGDQGALEGFRSNESKWLDSAALAVTTLGGQLVAAALVIGLISLLVFARRRVDAMVVLISAAPIVAGILLKDVVGRARPDLMIIGSEPTSLSFPSGHALFAMIFGGLLIILAGDLIKPVKLRWAIQIGLVLLIMAVGASRVYLGFHYPSDVLGSYLFGAMALLGLVRVRNWFAIKSATPVGATGQ